MTEDELVYQRNANISSLLEDEEYEERKDVLIKLIYEFKKAGIRWGLSCSMNLFIRGLVDDFHDLDIITDSEDIPLIIRIMEKMGCILKETGGNGFCESNVYMHFETGKVDIDIISGFRILTFGTKFLYEFNSQELEIVNLELEGELSVPLISMEAMFLLYSMMEGWQPKRRFKRVLIEEYLIDIKMIFPHILQRSLEEGNLPGLIKTNIRTILNKWQE